MKEFLEIPEHTRAYMGGPAIYHWEYPEYAEAIYSNKECKQYYPDGYSEEKKDELVNKYLQNSKDYFDVLQARINNLPNDGGIGNLTNDIVIFVGKIIDGIGIK